MDETNTLLNAVEDNPAIVTEVKKGTEEVKVELQANQSTLNTINNKVDDLISGMAAKSADDMANEKRQQAKNQTNVDNSTNVAGNQHVEYHYHTHVPPLMKEVYASGYSSDDEIKSYDLTTPEGFASFGEKYKASEHFAFAIVLCVFEHVELDDLHVLKASLMHEMPKITDDEGKEMGIKQDPYFSINSLVKIVSGKFYENDDGEKCVGLGDGRTEALKNLWEQFPSLRGCISRWLLSVSDAFDFVTNFEAYQISSAFVNIIKLDFSSSERHIFVRLYSSEKNTWLLGSIAILLYRDKKFSSRIISIVRAWIHSKGQWLWKPAYYFHTYIDNLVSDDDVEDELCKTLAYKIDKLLELRVDIFSIDDLFYISRFLIYSERARTLIAKTLKKILGKRKKYVERELLTEFYLIFLREGYWKVSDEHQALPLVVCDSKSQLLDIQPLASVALQKYDTKRPLFNLLQAYLKELSDYSVDEKDVKRLKAFFILWIENNSRHTYDITKMLKDCKCRMANNILEAVKTKIGGQQ
jgi:hypothetical protein